MIKQQKPPSVQVIVKINEVDSWGTAAITLLYGLHHSQGLIQNLLSHLSNYNLKRNLKAVCNDCGSYTVV